MKQEDESGNSDGRRDEAKSGTAPNESISSGDTNDAPKVVSANGDRESVSACSNTSGEEDHAAEPTGVDTTADSTRPELNVSANASGSSSCCDSIDMKPECEMERSSSSCCDLVSELSYRDNLSSCSESSTHDKSGRQCESSDMDNSHPPPVATWDERQTEAAHESISNPRDSLSSCSLSSTPSGISDKSGRISGISDTDHSPPDPSSGTALSSDGRQADTVDDSPSEQDTALLNARSPSTSKNKMTLRSGRVTQDECVSPKKPRDTSKMKRKFPGRTTKRRYSVDEQSQSSAEENPEKLLRLESSNTLTCLHEEDDSTSVMNTQSGDISNVSSASSMVTTVTTADDSPSKDERLPLADADDSPGHKASDTSPAEQEEAVVGNETSADKKPGTDSSEVALDNELKPVVKEEVVDPVPTNSESSAYQSANSAMKTGSSSPTDIGGENDFGFFLKFAVPEMSASNVPSAGDSGVSTEDTKQIQPSGLESHTSRDSALGSDKKEIIFGNSTETTTDTFGPGTCDDIEKSSEEAVNNGPQQNSVKTLTVEFCSDPRPVSPNVRKTQSEAKRGGFSALSFFAATSRRPEVDVRGERMQAISKTSYLHGPKESAETPDSSTEGVMDKITCNAATKVQQQISTNASHSSETGATTGDSLETKETASSKTQDNQDTTAENAPEDTDHESPEENSMSFSLSPPQQFDQRDLQIYRYITTNSGPDIRYSPYVTRRRPLRSGHNTGDSFRRIFIRSQREEARERSDNDIPTVRSPSASFGDNCNIS